MPRDHFASPDERTQFLGAVGWPNADGRTSALLRAQPRQSVFLRSQAVIPSCR
jgi:hypothetical protein